MEPKCILRNIEFSLNKLVDSICELKAEENIEAKTLSSTITELGIIKENFYKTQKRVADMRKQLEHMHTAIKNFEDLTEILNVEQLKLKTQIKNDKSKLKLQSSELDNQFNVSTPDQFIFYKKRFKLYLLKKMLNFTHIESSKHSIKGYVYNKEKSSLHPFELSTRNKTNEEISAAMWQIGCTYGSNNVQEFHKLFSNLSEEDEQIESINEIS